MYVQIDCINKREHLNPHERILYVGGFHNGKRWRQTEAETIRQIEGRINSFYVTVGGRSVDVIVAEHEGRKYLKTTADGYSPNNLLSLNECPLA